MITKVTVGQLFWTLLATIKPTMPFKRKTNLYSIKEGTLNDSVRLHLVGMRCKLSDGTHQWFDSKDLKQLNPVDVAQYAKQAAIADKLAFKWWVPYTMKKASAISKAVISCLYASKTKVGIKIPNSLAKCIEFDKENRNRYWQTAHQKESDTVRIAFEILEGKHQIPSDYTEAKGFMCCDLKLDFTRKACWVKAGNLTASTGASSYAGVVSRESVQIVLLYAALNNLNITCGDIKAAYLSSPTSEKHFHHTWSRIW